MIPSKIIGILNGGKLMNWLNRIQEEVSANQLRETPDIRFHKTPQGTYIKLKKTTGGKSTGDGGVPRWQ